MSSQSRSYSPPWDIIRRTFDLGFVEGNGKPQLIGEQTYQELFSISQALPGPASTKMVFCLAFLRGGFLVALSVFLIWSLPGAIGMYALSLGIEKIDEVLPSPVYALLSGLNASTVGIIALSAVQLARKAITDPLTRLLVLSSACAGLCYNALWYFPTLLAIGGTRRSSREQPVTVDEEAEAIPMDTIPTQSAPSVKSNGSQRVEDATTTPELARNDRSAATPAVDILEHKVPFKLGLLIIAGFFAIFTTLMVLRGTLRSPPLPLELFINMFLAGTIIFGGGPVVIPLLREYVVQPGWVSPRDFLIGLAIIQAFPGPNFNFAVYLGALALRSTNIPNILARDPRRPARYKSSQSSTDFRPGHGYQSSTDSSSYAPSFSSFENNLRLGGKSGSSSCGDDWTSEEGHEQMAKPLPSSRASSIITPAPAHSRNNSDNYVHLRPDSVTCIEPVRKPTIRMKNGVPHHSCNPEQVPYPVSYSSNMMAADRWNHALLFGDDRNPANAGGLLRGSTVSFSQFYGVGSGKKEVLKGRELRGGKVLDLGCGEGLWVLAAAKEWRHTCFVGFDLIPIQMDLNEKLDGVRNAQDIIDRIEWAQGDFLSEKLPFADNSFDLVRLANTTLALPADPGAGNCRLRGLFSEIFRVLKVDGEFEMIDENLTVPSVSKASPACPENAAFDLHTGAQMREIEQAFARMLQYHQLTAYDEIPGLLQQHFSTSSEKAIFRLAVTPDPNVVQNLRDRGSIEQASTRVELDRDLGLAESPAEAPTHGRGPSVGWETGISDANEGLWSGEQRSPRFASSPPPDATRIGSMGPLPSWRYESESDVVTVREIRVCLARKLNLDPPSIRSN
ncbi:hypothetical protein RSAG8_04167, partial [Rhizoctonia solani AG-8 WAC10335]